LEKYGTSFPEQKNFYSEYGVVIADPFTWRHSTEERNRGL
jgi:hypothetical protein